MKRPKATSQPVALMEAKSVAALPAGPEWVYEPKWDGFRCLVLKAGDDVVLQGKSGKPLGRFFPEVVKSVASAKLDRVALDAELVIRVDGALSFDALQMRLHPAESRIAKLSAETPAILTTFDTLLDSRGDDVSREPFKLRRDALGAICKKFTDARLNLTQQTSSLKTAQGWLDTGFAGTDGVVAKRLDLPYRFGERSMQKVKRIRSADCVVGGFRYAQESKVVGSLLLGLYNDEGLLDHVGFTSAFARVDKQALTARLEKLIAPPGLPAMRPAVPAGGRPNDPLIGSLSNQNSSLKLVSIM